MQWLTPDERCAVHIRAAHYITPGYFIKHRTLCLFMPFIPPFRLLLLLLLSALVTHLQIFYIKSHTTTGNTSSHIMMAASLKSANVDVLIIGAGPAGLTAALNL